MTKGKVVTMDLTNRYGTRIRINASVVDEIATLKKKDKARFDLLTEESAEEVKRQEGYENITKDNFQQVPGGKIQMLLGLDIGNDFLPREILTFRSGLKVSEHRVKLSDYASVAASRPTLYQCIHQMTIRKNCYCKNALNS